GVVDGRAASAGELPARFASAGLHDLRSDNGGVREIVSCAMTRILIDLTHTSHTRAHTGIQRVCRALHRALRERPDEVLPVCYDPYESTWRRLRRWEQGNLAPPQARAAGTRGSRWPLPARISGRIRR